MILSFGPSFPKAPLKCALAIILAFSLAIPDRSVAHEFTLAIRADNAGQLASAIRGVRLASTERDGHSNETSDGHLGGLDLIIQPEPVGADHGVDWLKRPEGGVPDIILLMSGDADIVDGDASGGLAMGTGRLRPNIAWDDDGRSPDGFVARFRALFAQSPDLSAAMAYNAARRIDLAVRPLGSVADRAALAESLSDTRLGIDW